MTTAQVEQLGSIEADAVLRWRFDELVRAGYEPRAATDLASHVEIDLHQAIELLRRGCTQATALLILL